MSSPINVPEMGESITEGQIASILKQVGEAVTEDEILFEIETDKVTMEIRSTATGVLSALSVAVGDTVRIGQTLAEVDPAGEAAAAPAATNGQAATPEPPTAATPGSGYGGATGAPNDPRLDPAPPEPKPAAADPRLETSGPAVRRLAEEHGVDTTGVTGTGKGGRLTKADVQPLVGQPTAPKAAAPPAPPKAAVPPPAPPKPAAKPAPRPAESGERETIKPMSRLRQRIAERLVEAQQTAAILTTFNEVDMSAVMALRSKYKDDFAKTHEVGLGFMSFFTKAALAALKAFPEINAEIRGTDVVYKHYYDIGIAVGGPKGLVVPIVRDADRLSMAGIEGEIKRLAAKAQDNSLGLDDLTGGTFTISNGGIYGSMMSTPILNPPQSGILGLHNIVKRAVVVGDQIVIRPMMYLALSYDHRMVDGKEAVQFLVKIKDAIEDPARLLLDL